MVLNKKYQDLAQKAYILESSTNVCYSRLTINSLNISLVYDVLFKDSISLYPELAETGYRKGLAPSFLPLKKEKKKKLGSLNSALWRTPPPLPEQIRIWLPNHWISGSLRMLKSALINRTGLVGFSLFLSARSGRGSAATKIPSWTTHIQLSEQT